MSARLRGSEAGDKAKLATEQERGILHRNHDCALALAARALDARLVVQAPYWLREQRMPHLFEPCADTVARGVLISIVTVPFLAIGLAY